MTSHFAPRDAGAVYTSCGRPIHSITIRQVLLPSGTVAEERRYTLTLPVFDSVEHVTCRECLAVRAAALAAVS